MKILIVDDEKAIRLTLREILEYEQYEIDEADNGITALEMIDQNKYNLVLCDIKMSKMEGMEVLSKSMALHPDLPFIMISGHGNVELAIEASKKGAFDFIVKPPDLNRLLITVRNALEKGNLVSETKILKKKIYKTKKILGSSVPVKNIIDTISKVAPTEARVLITGPNGSGKELVANWLHEKSNRCSMPFVEVNCAAIPSELIESELFGHEKGSFTSAIKTRMGKFEQANKGTIFLDEIGDMSLSAQAKVLRALQENKITRVGGDKEINVDVRVIAATNKNLLHEIEKGNFRIDLYHRLSVIIIDVPSLKERKDDIKIIAESFINDICSDYGINIKKISPDAMSALEELPWTGNIRELHNVIERLIILSDDEITLQDVEKFASVYRGKSNSLKTINLESFASINDINSYTEMLFIKYKMEENYWDINKVAKLLDMPVSVLNSKIEKYQITESK